MNDLPPKIPVSGSIAPKASKPLTSRHVVLGIAGGIVVGLLAGTLFWIVVWIIFLGPHVAREQQGQARFESTARTEAADPATIAEIDAAAQLSFENNKMAHFSQLAGRANLSPEAQAHLVEMVFKHLSFENNQLQVLLKL